MRIYKLGLSIAVLILWLQISCNSTSHEEYVERILGVENVEILDDKHYEQHNMDDYYYLSIYHLSKATADNFLRKKAKPLPPKTGSNSPWQKFDWSWAPVNRKLYSGYNLAMNYLNGADQEIKNQVDLIYKTIEKNSVIYAMYYTPDMDDIEQVEFFVFDPQTSKLYIMESNY